MKKLFILLAAAALMLPLASCHKDPGKDKDQPVEMKPAATADVAKVVSFESAPAEKKPTYNHGNVIYEMISIEFTEASRYILKGKAVATKAGNSDVEIMTGPYTEKNGTYQCTGDFTGTVTVSGTGSNKDVTVNTGGEEQTTTGNVSAPSSGSSDKTNASRTWKVASCIVNVSGNGLSVNKGFTGCNLQTIAAYIAENGGKNISPSDFAGYDVTEILFTGSNTVVISFKDAPDFGGSYTLNGESFSMTLEVGGNDLVNQKATGFLSFPADGKADFSLMMSFKGYTGGIDFTLTEVK
ncbi:MAG: hypothetical protein K6F42_06285 [Bacteroidales bacterium]|nr:hypothetical protein [Bacteroidales bacterium]